MREEITVPSRLMVTLTFLAIYTGFGVLLRCFLLASGPLGIFAVVVVLGRPRLLSDNTAGDMTQDAAAPPFHFVDFALQYLSEIEASNGPRRL